MYGYILIFDPCGWNDSIARDQLREDTTGSLYTESKRVDTNEDHFIRASSPARIAL